MKETLDFIQILLSEDKIDLSDFYVITLYPSQLNLQGYHSRELHKKYEKLFGKFIFDENHKYFILTNNNADISVDITLTT